MTNPNNDGAQLANLSDDYIRDLEPENQRYDITLAQDFVISVLPNGIKTWAFIYDFQGRNRRKTLGVFPEMNFEDAKVALTKARDSMSRMDEPTVAPNEFGQLPAVLGGSKYIPKKISIPFNWRRLLKVVGGLVLIGAIALASTLVVRDWKTRPDSAPADEAVEAPPKSKLPFTIDKKPAREPATKPAGSKPASAPPAASASVVNGDNAPRASQTTAAATQRPSNRNHTPAQNTGSSTSDSDNSRSRNTPVTTLASTNKATAFGGSVPRSRLTSRVQDLEPIDTLGPEISYKNSGFTRVFYFTELREFTDGNIVHRWSLNGEIKEEVVLKVKKSWRWRTYSNKDITPGLNGEWKVETIDATGKVLDTQRFTYDYS